MPIFDPDKLEKWSCGTWKDTPKGDISGFSIDSRNLHSGDLFVAIKAERNGHDFLRSATENGACASIVENVKLDVPLPSYWSKTHYMHFIRLLTNTAWNLKVK